MESLPRIATAEKGPRDRLTRLKNCAEVASRVPTCLWRIIGPPNSSTVRLKTHFFFGRRRSSDDAVGSELWRRVKRGGEGGESDRTNDRPAEDERGEGTEGGRRGALRELLLLLLPRYRPLRAAATLTQLSMCVCVVDPWKVVEESWGSFFIRCKLMGFLPSSWLAERTSRHPTFFPPL